MTIVMLITLVDPAAVFLALGEITGRRLTQRGDDTRLSRRRPRHSSWRHLQRLPIYVLLTKCY
jgi:hypothetical protein